MVIAVRYHSTGCMGFAAPQSTEPLVAVKLAGVESNDPLLRMWLFGVAVVVQWISVKDNTYLEGRGSYC